MGVTEWCIPPLCQSLAAERHLGKGLASAVSAAKYGWAKVWACLPVL